MLRLISSQDLAQELDQTQGALDYVMAEVRLARLAWLASYLLRVASDGFSSAPVAVQVRAHDPGVTDERCRTVMGSLGLVGEKALRLIGSLR